MSQESSATIIKGNTIEMARTFTVEVQDAPTNPNALVMKTGVPAMIQILKAVLRNSELGQKEWEESLEEYVKFSMLDMLGVEQHPILKNADGSIEGLSKEIELTVEGDGNG